MLRLLIVGVLATAGCITGFKHPLGPVGQGYIDERLLGTWSCASTDESGGEFTFLKFDPRQYYVRVTDPKSEPQDFRAVATRLEESSFLSLRVIGPKAEDEWTILRLTFSDVGPLSLSYVDPQAFEDLLDDPQAVRDRLVARIDDPEVVGELLRCTRRDGSQSDAGS